MIEQLRKHLAWADGWVREPYNDKTGNILRLTDGGKVSIENNIAELGME